MWPTPYLRVDVPMMDRRIAAVADACADRGLAVRPHVKTHKCPQIAHRQVAAGARGVTVATVGEAEVFAAAGLDDIFIAYPLWVDDERASRLGSVMRVADVSVGVDSVESATALARQGLRPRMMVEVDSGQRRTGVAPAEAGALAARVAGLGFDVAGVFTFPGHSYAPDLRLEAARQEVAALSEAAASMTSAGVAPRVVSGGSTPTLDVTLAGRSSPADVLTELRPGVYVVGDAQQVELGSCDFETVALTAVATVVSRRADRVVVDAGSKVLGADRPMWASGFGRVEGCPDARVVVLSEHHAVVEWPRGVEMPALGDRVRIIPNHACNAINSVDRLWAASGAAVDDAEDRAGEWWPVAARGRNT